MTPRVAIVTGSSSGIGRASAIALSKAGWTVVVSGRRKAETAETAALCSTEFGGGGFPVVSDINTPEGVEALFSFAKEKFGRVDLVFNNAGMGGPDVPIEEHSLELFDQIISANIRASFMMSQAAFKQMKSQNPQGGKIINNGSISAYAPRPNSAPYTLSKHAITGLTKSLALDGREFNISCGQVDVGNASTALSTRIGAKLQPNGDRMVEPNMSVDEVGNTIVFMASQPNGANILNVTVMASNMPFVGRG